LAVFVDDLDRCSSRNVVEVVEAINQIFHSLDNRHCVFILGMDREVVAASIEVSYEKTITHLKLRHNPIGDDFGLRFLSKIVQLSVAIPPPDPEAMKNLLGQITGVEMPGGGQSVIPSPNLVQSLERKIRENRPANPIDLERIRPDIETEAEQSAWNEAVRRVRQDLLTSDSEDVREAELEVLNFLDRNPRQVKRFDNAFRLQLRVASQTPGSTLDFSRNQLVALGKWVALRLRWPHLAADLDRDLDLLLTLEDYANNGASEATKPLEERYARWFSDEELIGLLREDDPARRIAPLPFDSFLRVA
jgi:hypothetical protein